MYKRQEPASDADDQEEEGPTVTIAVDPATNTLVVVGSPRLTDRLASLAEQIQQQFPQEATRTRVIRLPSSADANAIAQIVRQTVQRVGRASTENPSGFTGRPDVVPDLSLIHIFEGGLGVADVASLLTVSAEPATNTLIISAPPVAQELAQSLVDALDTDEVGAAAPVVRVVPLSYGRSDQIAPQLERAIDGLVLPSGGDVRVSSVGGANALIRCV